MGIIARREFVRLAGAAVAAPMLGRFAQAQAQAQPKPDVTLKLHHFFSPLSSVHARFLVPWAKKIAADSDGRIKIDLFGAMQLGGAPAELYDQARDGVADIVWTLPGMTPGRFRSVEVFELPFVAGRSALANATAVQEFADAGLKEEFRAVQPLCVCAHDRGLLHVNRPIATLADLKDARLRAPTRLAGEALKALGANSVSLPLPQVPAAFSNKSLDGCVLPWDAAAAIKLHELVKFHCDVAGTPTLSTSTFILAMNRAKYSALAPDLKKVIDDNSGVAAAAMVGRMWDEQAVVIEDMVRKRGNTVSSLSAEETARWRKATEPVIETWIADLKSRYIDGAKLIETASALVTKHEATAAAEPAAALAPASAPSSAPAPNCAQWCPSP